MGYQFNWEATQGGRRFALKGPGNIEVMIVFVRPGKDKKVLNDETGKYEKVTIPDLWIPMARIGREVQLGEFSTPELAMAAAEQYLALALDTFRNLLAHFTEPPKGETAIGWDSTMEAVYNSHRGLIRELGNIARSCAQGWQSFNQSDFALCAVKALAEHEKPAPEAQDDD